MTNFVNTNVSLYSSHNLINCRDVSLLPKDEQCDYVLATADCQKQPIPIYKWLYCDYTDEYVSIGITLIILILISMFLIISSVADVGIVPCVNTIAAKLKMSDTLAGVTVLAFSNGAPDVFTALASKLMGLSQIFYTGIAGGCMFVTTFVAGLILIIRPFKLDGWSLLRDLSFLLISYLILFTCFSVGVINLQMSFTFIALYITYISIVLLGQWSSIRFVQIKMKGETIDNKSDELIRKSILAQKSIYSQYPILREHRFSKLSLALSNKLDHPQVPFKHEDTIWSQFYDAIIPFNYIDWALMPWHERLLLSLQAPITIILKIIIPVCNIQQPLGGWSKMMVACNMLFFVPITLIVEKSVRLWALRTIDGIPFMLYLSLPGIVASIMILLLTEVNHPPSSSWVLAFIGFPMSILMVNYFCNIVVLLLEGIGTKLGISYSTLGMTLLAWGNSLGDLVSNTTLAKNGVPRMAFAACFGAPLFTCIFGAGVTSLVSIVSTKDVKTSVYLEITGHLVSYFVFASLITSIITFTLIDMDGRRSYGGFLITLYLTFFTMVIIIESIK